MKRKRFLCFIIGHVWVEHLYSYDLCARCGKKITYPRTFE